MRVLVATTANDGHFGPVVPFAGALLARGHEVRVTAPASFVGKVRGAGLVHEPFADAPPELVGPVMSTLPSLSFDEANATVVRDIFARIDAQAALPGLTDVIERWRPDVILREPAELGSLAAAERAGIRHGQVAIGMQETIRDFQEIATGPLAELARIVGLDDGRLSLAWRREPTFSTVTERLDRAGDDGYQEVSTILRVAGQDPSESEPAGEPSLEALVACPPGSDHPESAPRDSARPPLVYVTLGSVTGSLPPFAGLFQEALDALEQLPVRVLMTVGNDFDPARLVRCPQNATVLRWWPQSEVLRTAAAVLHHGGFGTSMGALAAGLPQVVAPVFSSDQLVNSRHIAAIGAGVAVAPGPDLMTRAVAALPTVLADPTYAAAAERTARDLEVLPSIAVAVAAVEDWLS